MKKSRFIPLIVMFIIMFFPKLSISKISTEEVEIFGNKFMLKIINDNPSYERKIRKCFNALTRQDSVSMRLKDKLAIFWYDCTKRGIKIKSAKFINQNSNNIFFIILKDTKDNQQYTLYLDYSYDSKTDYIVLNEIYFSLVFNEQFKKYF